MTLKYYHGPALANGLKSMIPLIEKNLPYESVYIDLHKFEQHEPWFLKINPEGQVPVLDHDGVILNHSSVINEYLAGLAMLHPCNERSDHFKINGGHGSLSPEKPRAGKSPRPCP